MPYLLIRCQVENAADWAPVVADEFSLLRASGVKSIRIFANAADPHEIVGLFEWDDLNRARLFSRSDGAGKDTVKRLPLSSVLCTLIQPPWALAIQLTKLNPRPRQRSTSDLLEPGAW